MMPDLPYPPDNGARADIWDRLRAMNRLGYIVHALVMAQKVPPKERYINEMRSLVSSLQFVERRPLGMSLATITPTYIQRNSPLAEVPLRDQYDLTLMEEENTLPICDNPSLQTALRVLRVHNDALAYMWQYAKAEENLVRKLFICLDALRMIPYSKSVHRRVDSLWFISQSECQRFTASHPGAAAKAAWLPPCITLREKPQRTNAHCKRVLFVGNFYTSLNRQGLRWYLNHIHPLVTRDPGYELVIAGSTQGRPAAHLFAEELKQETRCTVHVDLEDTQPLYQDSAVFINPMRSGAGVKLKSVHAIERGIPVVSTSVGNEGSGFEDKVHLRIADTPVEFASALTNLLNDSGDREHLALRAREQLIRLYGCEANIRRLITNLLSYNSRNSADKDAVFPQHQRASSEAQ